MNEKIKIVIDGGANLHICKNAVDSDVVSRIITNLMESNKTVVVSNSNADNAPVRNNTRNTRVYRKRSHYWRTSKSAEERLMDFIGKKRKLGRDKIAQIDLIHQAGLHVNGPTSKAVLSVVNKLKLKRAREGHRLMIYLK